MTNKEAISELKSYAENSWGGLSEAFEKAIKSLERQRWIPVEERLPEGDCLAACFEKNSFWSDTIIVGSIKYSEDYETYIADGETEYIEDVTHWMPLPEKPKVENETD